MNLVVELVKCDMIKVIKRVYQMGSVWLQTADSSSYSMRWECVR